MYNVETVQQNLKAIATAHADFARTSFEQGKTYVAQLAQVKSPDQAVECSERSRFSPARKPKTAPARRPRAGALTFCSLQLGGLPHPLESCWSRSNVLATCLFRK